MLKSFCVIPARSGSKGLRDKNILDLAGKPVIAYTIGACLDSGLFDCVYVATDSEKYADIAVAYGAIVPFLEPEDMAGDSIPSTEPLLHFYTRLKADADLLWCMQPTSPLRSSEDIIRAYQVLEEHQDCKFVLGTTEVDPHYFHWALRDDESGFSSLYFGNKMLVDRSELKEMVYRPNGAIKVGKTEAVCKQRNFFGDKIMRVEMPEERSVHIRSQIDLSLCEMLMSRR